MLSSSNWISCYLHAKRLFSHMSSDSYCHAKLLSSLKHFTSVFTISPVIHKAKNYVWLQPQLEKRLLKSSATNSHFCGNCWSFIKNFQGKIEFNPCRKIILKIILRKAPQYSQIPSHLLVVFFKKPVNCPLSSWNDEFLVSVDLFLAYGATNGLLENWFYTVSWLKQLPLSCPRNMFYFHSSFGFSKCHIVAVRTLSTGEKKCQNVP